MSSEHLLQPVRLLWHYIRLLRSVNFAFGYIDPQSFQIVPMDGATPSSLFKDTANIKSIKPSIKVWISVGGWTFSDNGTATQPVFGNIAASAANRQTFANNAVSFMKQYGKLKLLCGSFDGLDIDWEYPGAPDRGGVTADTANYVELVRTLRNTFSASGGDYGISFTAPSSYWYLRWFDLPGMVKYVDWINLMTYDLHGVWDAGNPIGSIVQGHTNLTEIKAATELFWRVNIPASKISMGIGFYGRSFTLSNSGCATPGCGFKGASNAGPCSAAGGILAYYEIMSVLQKNTGITPTWDKTAAVKYFTFSTDQWVSYDDADTLKQKVDWANSVGLSGVLIWASDLDDDKYTAHAGLVGRSVYSNNILQTTKKTLSAPQAVIQDIAGSNGQNCFAYTGKCVALDDFTAMATACGRGFTVVGWDDAGCGTKKCSCNTGWAPVTQKSGNCFFGSQQFCCKTPVQFTNCQWRGGSGGQECANADCNSDEVEVDRDQFGDSKIGGCSSCCKLKDERPVPARCTTDLCSAIKNYCPNDDDDESANGRELKRDLLDLLSTNITDVDAMNDEWWSQFDKRGSPANYRSVLASGVVITTVSAAYPSIGRLYKVANAGKVIKKSFKTAKGYCLSGSAAVVVENLLNTGSSALATLQSEHPFDAKSAAIAAIGAIGNSNGASPNTPAARIMECFGSTKFPNPFLPTGADINGAKGRVMGLKAATAISTISKLARAAVKADSQAAVDLLLQSIRIGVEVFDYLNTPEARDALNLVRDTVATQLSLIETVTRQGNLKDWWLLWSGDYLARVSGVAQKWLIDATTAAAEPFQQAAAMGVQLSQYDTVIDTLTEFAGVDIFRMTIPGQT
ncbi:hypothetical protein LTR28_003418 [Elasticomyces elasticus]|nr:hypothetical protein LTR28_003418 [Elasticomyces elasticus]